MPFKDKTLSQSFSKPKTSVASCAWSCRALGLLVHYKNAMLASVGYFYDRVDFVTLYFGSWIYEGTFEACFDGF
jgi:hypothetical protein